MTFFRKTAFHILCEATKASAQDTARVTAGAAVVLGGYAFYHKMSSLSEHHFFKNHSFPAESVAKLELDAEIPQIQTPTRVASPSL